jgi:hypothetical protein
METQMTFQLIYDCIKGRLWALIYLLWWWMKSQETYKMVSLGVCFLQMMWFWSVRVGRGSTRNWNCWGEHLSQKVLGLVDLKQSTRSVILVLPCRRRGVGVFCTGKNKVVKITRSSSEVVLQTIKQMMIYPSSGPFLEVIAIHPAV